ncbi:MAG: phosphoesterase [Thermoguttaceae bacterium]|nr:phosphoesterase [Thermoguttaceae bacterium]
MPKDKNEERVLVLPTRLFREFGYFQGFSAEAGARADALLRSPELRFMRRGDAERDPEFKQLIPYVAFTCRDQIFAYRRGAGAGEARLRAKCSVGVGGHVAQEDADDPDPAAWFENGLKREIAEEVALGADVAFFERLGLVNDDSTEVGTVHLGVVCRAELTAPELTSNEPDLIEAGFRKIDDLAAEIEKNPDDFESWTIFAVAGIQKRP